MIDLTGDHSLLDRAQTLYNSEFFIGVSSGLSWLSWASGTHTILISDFTPIHHEFKTNISRISANPELTSVNYNMTNITKPETVIESIKKYLESKN